MAASIEATPRFTHESFDWLEGLEANNDKGWFEAHRTAYDLHVRRPLEALLLQAQAQIGGNLKLFRQHRDTRFSADKSPYRKEAVGTLHGRLASDAGLYAELSGDGLLLASGNHFWAKDQLGRYLDAAASPETGEALAAAVEQLEVEGWTIEGELLKTVPKAYPKDHPQARLLKHKFLVAGYRIPAADVVTTEDFDAVLETFWRKVIPLNAWLDAHVGLSSLPPDRRR